jgi:hypothetical protein
MPCLALQFGAPTTTVQFITALVWGGGGLPKKNKNSIIPIIFSYIDSANFSKVLLE